MFRSEQKLMKERILKQFSEYKHIWNKSLICLRNLNRVRFEYNY